MDNALSKVDSALSIRRGKVRKYQNFVFGSSILDVTYEYVYLGVNFNYNTSSIKAIEDIYLELSVLCLPLLPKVNVYHYRYNQFGFKRKHSTEFCIYIH